MAIDSNDMLSELAQEIHQATERLHEGECREDELPSAVDLARKLNYRLEAVKKKLRVLKEADLIHPTSMTPKRYRFNLWVFKTLDEDHPMHDLLSSLITQS